MMRVQYHRYGGPDELRLEEVAVPQSGRGQLRVRVHAAAANPMDWKIRKGELKMMTGGRFPRGLGHDFAGVVEALGPGVTRFAVGDEVFGATGLKAAGAFAEALVADEANVFHKPPSLSFLEAAALPIVTATAWTALIDLAELRAGQSVFITGCLGGVGRLAVQLARVRGGEVTGSCSGSGSDEARALGVQEVVDYRAFHARTYKGRFDVVLDAHGSLSVSASGAMLKPGGLALHVVPTPAKMIWSRLSGRHRTVFAQLTPQSMDEISQAVGKGQLKPTIGRTVPLSEAIPALIDLESHGLRRGKLVVVVP